jgi:AraC-like DNA-binding protein
MNAETKKPRVYAETTVQYEDLTTNFYVNNHSGVTYARPHLHSCFELELILGGEGNISINGVEYRIERGALFLASPADIHELRADSPIHLLNLKFLSLPESVGINLGCYKKYCSIAETDIIKLEALLGVIESEHGNCASDGVAEACFESALKLAARYLIDTDAQTDSAVSRALSFMHSRYTDNITLTDIAKAVGFTSSHLSVTFHSQVGVKIKTYLTTLRVEHARRLMDTTILCMLDIALESGFNTYSAFLRAFTKTVGMIPVEYRAKGKTKKS